MERSRLSVPPETEIDFHAFSSIFSHSFDRGMTSGGDASTNSAQTASNRSSLPIDPMTLSLAKRMGDASALHLWSRSHFIIGLILFEIAAYLAFCGPLILFTVVIIALSLLFFTTVAFRLLVVYLAIVKDPIVKVSEEQCQSIDQSTLPVYTILVPLFKEANVAGSVIRSLSRLQYPRDRLDIKLLLEGDDTLTVDAVNSLTLGSEYEKISIPPSHPRTKPKACNHGLSRARGEFVVIYDAEDRPEGDQLLKAVYTFREAPPSVACIQAKLNYFNARENLLTRCFAVEYTSWFDMILPGLQTLGAPIPLGGTSNHFRTRDLIELGGWDPFNVTEDCDLGIRLTIRNRQTLLLDSTTWEEANTEVGNWIRQRSRWVKGYFQTHLVHTKNPIALLSSLGPIQTMYFFLTVGGVALVQLLNIVLWGLMAIYFVLLAVDFVQGRDIWTVVAGSRDEFRVAWKMIYLDAGENPVWSRISLVAFVASITMFFANGVFILTSLLACQRRNYGDLWFAALLSPGYWILTSIAAWKGAIQLIRRPHYWEKTRHGLSRVADPDDQSEVAQATA